MGRGKGYFQLHWSSSCFVFNYRHNQHSTVPIVLLSTQGLYVDRPEPSRNPPRQFLRPSLQVYHCKSSKRRKETKTKFRLFLSSSSPTNVKWAQLICKSISSRKEEKKKTVVIVLSTTKPPSTCCVFLFLLASFGTRINSRENWNEKILKKEEKK